MPPLPRKTMRWLWLILCLGLLLRLFYATDQPTAVLYRHYDGGDSGWYLANGAGFYSGSEHGYIRNIPFYISNLPTPPFYIILAGAYQQILPQHEAIVALRLTQCLISVGVAWIAFQLARRIVADWRAGLLAAASIALHPAFIAEANTIATETWYIFFIAMGLWLYIAYVCDAGGSAGSRRLSPGAAICLAGLAFGMATLTRAVSALFPLLLLAHLMWLRWRDGDRQHLLRGAALLLVYGALVSTWTIYNLALWNRFVIVSDQLMPAIWRAAVDNDGGPEQNDRLLLQSAESLPPDDCEVDCGFQHATSAYATQIQASVGGDLVGYALRRFGEMSSSFLQPHGTIPFGKVSVRDSAAEWAAHDRGLDGLLRLLRIEGFGVKLLIWLLHLGGIGLGMAGMWLTRAEWRLTMPLIGFIAYTLAAHVLLLDQPRYFFPLEFIWLLFAAAAICALLPRRDKARI